MSRNSRRRCRPQLFISASAIGILLGYFAAVADVHAGIISSSGVTQTTTPSGVTVNTTPTTVANFGALQPIIYPESSGVVGLGGMPVDHLVAGDAAVEPVLSGNVIESGPFEAADGEGDLSPGSIPQGIAYETYFFHFDPQTHEYYNSSIVFSTPILGVQIFTSAAALQRRTGVATYVPYTGTLESGDAVSGHPASFFPSGDNSRGLEEEGMDITNGGNGIFLSGDSFAGQVDQVRIFVAVPEPSSVLLALMGLLGLHFLAIKKTGANRSF